MLATSVTLTFETNTLFCVMQNARFDDAFVRKRLLFVHPPNLNLESMLKSARAGSNDSHQSNLRHLQSDQHTCICLEGTQPSNMGPTIADFQELFLEEVTKLQISAVTEPSTAMLEGQPVSCSSIISQFKSTVFTSLKVHYDLLTEEEMEVWAVSFASLLFVLLNLSHSGLFPFLFQLLEQSFRDTYNAYTFFQCDGFFRTITDVTMVKPSSSKHRGLQKGMADIPIDFPQSVDVYASYTNGTNVTFDWPTWNRTTEDFNATAVMLPAVFLVKVSR